MRLGEESRRCGVIENGAAESRVALAESSVARARRGIKLHEWGPQTCVSEVEARELLCEADSGKSSKNAEEDDVHRSAPITRRRAKPLPPHDAVRHGATRAAAAVLREFTAKEENKFLQPSKLLLMVSTERWHARTLRRDESEEACSGTCPVTSGSFSSLGLSTASAPHATSDIDCSDS